MYSKVTCSLETERNCLNISWGCPYLIVMADRGALFLVIIVKRKAIITIVGESSLSNLIGRSFKLSKYKYIYFTYFNTCSVIKQDSKIFYYLHCLDLWTLELYKKREKGKCIHSLKWCSPFLIFQDASKCFLTED